VESLSCQELANLYWAAAQSQQSLQGLDDAHTRVVSILAFSVLRSSQSPVHDSSQLSRVQLPQAHAWLKDLGSLQLLLSAGTLAECEAAWRQAVADNQQSSLQGGSTLAGDVWAVLQVLSQRHGDLRLVGLEHLAHPDQLFSVDIMVEVRGELLAVEVDGPSHFVRWLTPTQPGRPPCEVQYRFDSPTLHRNASLAARGHRVVSVGIHEWRHLRTPQQQEAYLGQLLALSKN